METNTNSNLQKAENTGLAVSQKIQSTNSYVMALQDKRVIECTDMEIDICINAGITKVYFMLGLKAKDYEDSFLMKSMLLHEVKDSFKMLTLEELTAAMMIGVKGAYEQEPVYGVSVIRVTKWFAAYMSAAERKQAKEDLKKLLEPKPYGPTEEEKQILRIENVKAAWETFKKQGKVDDVGNAVYTTLSRMKIVSFTEQRRNEFKEKAKAQLIAFYEPSKMIGNIGGQMDYRKVLNGLKEGIEQERIIVEAKKIALNTFFKELLEIGTEIQDLIE